MSARRMTLNQVRRLVLNQRTLQKATIERLIDADIIVRTTGNGKFFDGEKNQIIKVLSDELHRRQ